jgi:26S proteasome regulatory subunit N7
MKIDRYFHKHYTYYVREMRIIGYNQLLESYSSLTLKYMADAFGVSNIFIDK